MGYLKDVEAIAKRGAKKGEIKALYTKYEGQIPLKSLQGYYITFRANAARKNKKKGNVPLDVRASNRVYSGPFLKEYFQGLSVPLLVVAFLRILSCLNGWLV